jgi:hypothetical protein
MAGQSVLAGIELRPVIRSRRARPEKDCPAPSKRIRFKRNSQSLVCL